MKGPAVAAAIVFGSTLSPADAASITSEDFVAVVRPTADFLAAASRLALAQGGGGRLRRFARVEATDAEATSDTVAEWRRAERQADAEASAAPTVDGLGPLAAATALRLGAIADATADLRKPFTALPSADRLRAIGQEQTTRLAALRGTDFDDLYIATQRDGLTRLEAVYKDFILNGDDETLRALAVRELPKTRRLLADLGRA